MGAKPFVDHAPGRTRTSDPQLRRLLLYPPELLALPVTQVGNAPPSGPFTIGATGFEPVTSCSQSRRDTRLRYAPGNAKPKVTGGPGQPRALTFVPSRTLREPRDSCENARRDDSPAPSPPAPPPRT